MSVTLDPARRVRLGLFMSSPILGGAEQYFKDVVHRTDRQRFELYVYYDHWAAFEQFLDLDKLAGTHPRPLHCVDFTRHVTGDRGNSRPSPPALRERIARRLAAWLLSPVTLFRLWFLFRIDGLELMHINNGGYPGSLGARLAAFAAKNAGCRGVVMTVCGTPAHLRGPFSLIEHHFDAIISRALNCCIVLTHHMASALRARNGFATATLDIIPFGIAAAPASSALSPGVHRLGMVANFLPYKGHRYLIEAVHRLTGEFPQMQVVLIGCGPERPAVEDAIAQRGLGSVFQICGPLSNRETRQQMESFDLLVLPSLTEGLPYVIIEAMSCGKPVVAFAAGGIPELIVDGDTGFVVPIGDVESLSDCLRALLGSTGLRSRMGERALRRYQQFYTLEDMIRSTGIVYERLLCCEPAAPAPVSSSLRVLK